MICKELSWQLRIPLLGKFLTISTPFETTVDLKVKFLEKLAFIKKAIELGKVIWLGAEHEKNGGIIKDDDHLYSRH
tara:strand:- start:775 stop:1002 length:228 start_codon:yes stop_codon:yes gene_type:complete